MRRRRLAYLPSLRSDLKCFSLMETVQQLSLQVSKEQDELKAVQAELLSFVHVSTWPCRSTCLFTRLYPIQVQ